VRVGFITDAVTPAFTSTGFCSRAGLKAAMASIEDRSKWVCCREVGILSTTR
jgi:hypothetical protein